MEVDGFEDGIYVGTRNDWMHRAQKAESQIAELTRQRELLRSQFVAADVAAKAERLLLIDARAELEQAREALRVSQATLDRYENERAATSRQWREDRT